MLLTDRRHHDLLAAELRRRRRAASTRRCIPIRSTARRPASPPNFPPTVVVDDETGRAARHRGGHRHRRTSTIANRRCGGHAHLLAQRRAADADGHDGCARRAPSRRRFRRSRTARASTTASPAHDAAGVGVQTTTFSGGYFAGTTPVTSLQRPHAKRRAALHRLRGADSAARSPRQRTSAAADERRLRAGHERRGQRLSSRPTGRPCSVDDDRDRSSKRAAGSTSTADGCGSTSPNRSRRHVALRRDDPVARARARAGD